MVDEFRILRGRFCAGAEQLFKNFVKGFADRVTFEHRHTLLKHQNVTPEAPVWLSLQTFEERPIVDFCHHG